jgi:hypothetical protein
MPRFDIPGSVRLLRLCAPLLASSMTASMVVSAAPITWNAPVAVRTGSGNSSDVSTNGTLVEAYNAAISSYTGGNKTVNGVTFIATTITVVYTNNGFIQATPPPVRTWSFDAGASADALIVTCSGKVGNAVAGAGIIISCAGSPMNLAVGGGTAAILFPNLSTTNYTGGAADLVVDLSNYNSRNGLGIGAVSIKGSLDPGESIALHTTASGGSSAQVALTTTINDAFTVASFNADGISGTVAVDSPLTQIHARANIGSARGGAGYEVDVDAGSHVCSWTVPNSPRTAVATAFVVIPEPYATYYSARADSVWPSAAGVTSRGPEPLFNHAQR